MALAYATDLATGHSRDFALRSCVLAMRMAEAARLDDPMCRAVYHQARLAELRGNAGDAKKLYQEVLDKNPNTSLRADITNRLAVLELK